MTSFRLLVRNLFHFWRTNLAVLSGVLVATAVIGGALVVGESVKESLAWMSRTRLGRIDHAVTGGRFFREQLADDLQQHSSIAERVAPALILRATAEFRQGGEFRRAGGVDLYGVDERLWSLLDHEELVCPSPGEIVINRRVADELGLTVGEQLSLIVEVPAAIPRDSLLGERTDTVTELVVQVSGIAEDQIGLSRLGLNPTQQIPANAFVALSELQEQVGLLAVERSRQNPTARPARVNSLLISTRDEQISSAAAQRLSAELSGQLRLPDLSLRLVDQPEHGYCALESEQMFLEPLVARAAQVASSQLGLNSSPLFVYLFNEIWKPETPDQYSMYGVVAGLGDNEPAPFGPFEFTGPHEPLTGNAVYLNEWLASDLGAAVGDDVRVKYHVVGDRGQLPEEEQVFRVAGIVSLTGPAVDRGYAPEVPGVTDAESYADWNEPFPLKKNRITARDDEYWERYRTTPKIFISLPEARSLWRNRYGDLTSVRLAPRSGESLADLHDDFERKLFSNLEPMSLGMRVQPVKELGLAASRGATDFSGLFLGFSMFLIVAALLLVGLLFRLGVERRLSELGLLSAVGISPRFLRRLLLLEGGILAIGGGLLGMAAAVGFAALMIHGLKTWWYGAIGTRFLFLFVRSSALLGGCVMAVMAALVVIWWAQRRVARQPVRELLNGNLPQASAKRSGRLLRSGAAALVGVSLLGLLLGLVGAIPDKEAFAGLSWKVVMFFGVGVGFLAGCLTALAAWLTGSRTGAVRGGGPRGEIRLGVRNAARNRARSVLTAALIASATFVIVAVGAGQQNPADEVPRAASGNGGFSLVAEANVPLLFDLNTPSGRASLGLGLLNSQEQAQLEDSRVFPFRVQPGENASCLNLYQTQLPTILGVPADVLADFSEQARFRFADTPGEHPWMLLEEELSNGNVPVLGDMNTLMYSLHLGIGSTLSLPSDASSTRSLEVRGMLANSVFQGVLLMSEKNFLELFPRRSGFQYFLIETPPEEEDALSGLLETHLRDYGFDAEPVSRRLAGFLAVQNTYLSTFLALGGLGLLLGTLGLAAVMLRNILERRGELALLRAVGFRRLQVGRLVLWENALVLLWGLAAGTVSALLAMLPHLRSAGADVPWGGLALLLVGVFCVGMFSALAAVRGAVNTPVLSTLRGE